MQPDLKKLSVSTLPLVFSYREVVAGERFLAGVQIRGRALAELHDDGVTMEGISPGGISTAWPAASIGEAHAEFRREFLGVLFEIAASVADFAAFQRDVERFVSDTSPTLQSAWVQAVKETRDAAIGSAETGLPVVSADVLPSVQVVELVPAVASPQLNVIDPEPALAA